MKGYYFFLEYPTNKDKRAGTRKNPGNHSGTVLAVNVTPGSYWITKGDICLEAYGSFLDIPNGSCCPTSCTDKYLRENCKRISEKMARTIHPKLFNYLEQ